MDEDKLNKVKEFVKLLVNEPNNSKITYLKIDVGTEYIGLTQEEVDKMSLELANFETKKTTNQLPLFGSVEGANISVKHLHIGNTIKKTKRKY